MYNAVRTVEGGDCSCVVNRVFAFRIYEFALVDRVGYEMEAVQIKLTGSLVQQASKPSFARPFKSCHSRCSLKHNNNRIRCSSSAS
jgi:hypothetical protein